MTTLPSDKRALFSCKECGLHYRDEEVAKRCEAWCREHKSCNLEVIREAEENREGGR